MLNRILPYLIVTNTVCAILLVIIAALNYAARNDLKCEHYEITVNGVMDNDSEKGNGTTETSPTGNEA